MNGLHMPVVIKIHSFGHLQEFNLPSSPDPIRKTVYIERVENLNQITYNSKGENHPSESEA